jgi:hypothetical protein
MILTELEDLRSGGDQSIELPALPTAEGWQDGLGRPLATVRLTGAGRAAAGDAGAWTAVATMLESELSDEVTHIVTRTARRSGHHPPFTLECGSLPPILDGTVAVVRVQVGTGGPELPAEPEGRRRSD